MKRLRFALKDVFNSKQRVQDLRVHLAEAMSWLCRAQDAAGGGGVARSYSLRWNRAHKRRGWLDAYPETTGYIIPTLFDYAAFTGEPEYARRAIAMAKWEVEVQMPNGAVQGGTVAFAPTPAVFNTGQVLFGWARAFRETGDEEYRRAAMRAANFLLAVQDRDGAWRRSGSQYARAGINLYDARTAWGLVETFSITGDSSYREAAVRNLNFVLARQRANGWFPDCCLDDNDRPLVHTIAYTAEALLESGVSLEEARYVTAARAAADALLARQEKDGSLPGRFDQQWQAAARWSCLTGDAQTALIWLRLCEFTGERKYLEAASRMNRFLSQRQDIATSEPGVRGAIKGSHPIWAEYSPFEYPNWAAKFFADSLLLQIKLEGKTNAVQSQKKD